MKEIFVKDLRKDQEITTFFMAKNPAIKIGANGKQYLDITLADKTGEVSGKKWDVGDSEYNALAALYNKQIVKIKGLVVEWAGQLQIRVQRIRAAAESDEQQMRDFVKAAPEEPEEPDENAYELDKKSNAEIVADPGKWAYTSPAEDALVSAPSYNNGVLTMDISSMIRDTQNVYQLRYQPELEAGTEYTVTFTYKIESDDQTAYLSFGSTFANTESWSGIKDNGDGTYTVTYTDKIFADKPFFIQINTRSETTPVAIKVTVSNVTFTAKEPAVPESGSYELELMNSGDTKANPGAWTYWIDNGATLEAVPEYNDGSITFAVTEMPAGSNCVLRYQPDLAEGTSYTFTAKIKIVSEDPTARFVYGYDYRSSVTLTPDAEGWYTVAWTGQVSAENQPFSISLNSDTRELPITIEVTNIVFTANA